MCGGGVTSDKKGMFMEVRKKTGTCKETPQRGSESSFCPSHHNRKYQQNYRPNKYTNMFTENSSSVVTIARISRLGLLLGAQQSELELVVPFRFLATLG